MRFFSIAAFVLVASFGIPFLASAAFVPAGNAGTVTAPSGGVGNAGTVVPPSVNDSGQNVTLINPLKGADCSSGNGNCLESFLINILQFVVRIGAIIVILMLVYVGFLFVAAQGKEAELTKARSALLWTVIGALVLLGAQAIAMGIQATVQALGG